MTGLRRLAAYARDGAPDMHATGQACQTLGAGRLDKAVVDAFLEAVAPAAVAATAGAIGELEDQHEARMAGQRLALERAQYEADCAQRKFDACEPENCLVGRTPGTGVGAGADQRERERERGRLTALAHARPAALSDPERQALAALARDLPRLWAAPTTTDRDRKGPLRTLVSAVIVPCHHDERRADERLRAAGTRPPAGSDASPKPCCTTPTRHSELSGSQRRT